MATSKGANTYNRQNWEESDFPILCQTCLGENPYIRMMKDKFGKECKICNRPFTIFRWCPGPRMRFKKTEICQTCSQIKNVCQTCLLDLEYGLPVQVRDASLRITDTMPKSDVNKEYYTQNMERQIANSDGTNAVGALTGKAQAPSDMLLKLARTTPYYKRNRPHICSFWVKGECKRGEECPYRHEKPTDPDDPLADQNIRDRFYGTNDPVADKLQRRFEDMPKLIPPEDKTITTLYVGNLGDRVEEKDLRDHFYQYGAIRSIKVVAKQQCAFIQYTDRISAEKAAEKTYSSLIIKGQRLNVKWGRAQGQQPSTNEENESSYNLPPVPGLPAALGKPPVEMGYFNLPPPAMPPPMMSKGMPMYMPRLQDPPGMKPFGVGINPGPNMMGPPPHMGHPPPPGVPPKPMGIHYPSQDPTRMGAPSRKIE